MCELKGLISLLCFRGSRETRVDEPSQDPDDANGLGLPSYMGMICGPQKQ